MTNLVIAGQTGVAINGDMGANISALAPGLSQDDMAFLQQQVDIATNAFSGGVLRLSLDKKKMVIKSGDTVIYNFESGPMQIVIAGMTATNQNVYYEDSYSPNIESKPPVCFSMDAIAPDPSVPLSCRQSATCKACPHKQSINNRPKKCSIKHRTVAFVVKQDGLVDFDNPFIMDVGALSMFSPSLSGQVFFNFKDYVSLLAKSKAPIMLIKTLVTFTGDAQPALYFSPVMDTNGSLQAVVQQDIPQLVSFLRGPVYNDLLTMTPKVEAVDSQAPAQQQPQAYTAPAQPQAPVQQQPQAYTAPVQPQAPVQQQPQAYAAPVQPQAPVQQGVVNNSVPQGAQDPNYIAASDVVDDLL